MNGPSPASSLLTPSLAGAPAHQLLLSPRATFFTSFFGGPIAALILMGINLQRLGRLRREVGTLVVGAFLALGALAFGWVVLAQPELLGSFAPEDARRAGSVGRRLNNLLGLMTWGLFYLRMRVDLRAAELSRGEFENPWKLAGLAVVCSVVLHAVVNMLAVLLTR